MVLQATYDLLDYDTPRVHRFEVFTNTEFNGYLRRADGWSTALLTVFDALEVNQLLESPCQLPGSAALHQVL